MSPSLQKIRCALTFVVLAASSAQAQVVSIRTAPVSVPQQFFTFPSRTFGMGGGLALNDLEADPFSNPAAAGRIRGAIVAATPSIYHVSQGQGFGRTFPITLMGGGPEGFGMLSLAPQEVQTTPRNATWWQTTTPGLRTERFAHNVFAAGLLGQRFEQSRSAVAFGFSYANLNRVHMVDLLYPDATKIDQGGYIADMRLGYTKQLQKEQTLEAVVVRNHVDMTHTVTYVDNIWNPSLRIAQPLERTEYNGDQTTTWGSQVTFKGAMPEKAGWRYAASFTANTKTHPKIPNYNFMRIPKDPGNSWAFSMDGGVAWMDTVTTVALDVSYMPIWTSTWAEAATVRTTRTGKTIPIGAPTIENEFVFSNTNVHAGWEHRFTNVSAQLGLNLLHIGYALEQYDHIQERARSSNEGWTEGTLFWGMIIHSGRFDVRYFGSHQGRINLDFGREMSSPIVNIPTTSGPDVVAAPSSPLSNTMFGQTTPVTSHQFMISVPFGRR